MKKTFTILHTNDMHASFIGMGPARDYTPFKLNDDATRGQWAGSAVGLGTVNAFARRLIGSKKDLSRLIRGDLA